MRAMASQITSLTIVYSTVYSRHRSKKTSKLRVTSLCEGNSPVTGEFPAQRASNAENVPIWWRHHGHPVIHGAAHVIVMPTSHQVISNHHVDSTVTGVKSYYAMCISRDSHQHTMFERVREVGNPLVSVFLAGSSPQSDIAICEGCWCREVSFHYTNVIMCAMASQITSLSIVYSTVYTGADQRKHQSSASLVFVWRIHRWPVNSPHKWPVTRKMLPFDDVIVWDFIIMLRGIASCWVSVVCLWLSCKCAYCQHDVCLQQ